MKTGYGHNRVNVARPSLINITLKSGEKRIRADVRHLDGKLTHLSRWETREKALAVCLHFIATGEKPPAQPRTQKARHATIKPVRYTGSGEARWDVSGRDGIGAGKQSGVGTYCTLEEAQEAKAKFEATGRRDVFTRKKVIGPRRTATATVKPPPTPAKADRLALIKARWAATKDS